MSERLWAGAVAVLALALCGRAEAAPTPAEVRDATVSELVVMATKTVSEFVVTAPASKTVDELVVTARVTCRTPAPPSLPRVHPSVVSSYPAKGQAVRPGLVVIRVTFDQPVACAGALTDDAPLANPCPGRVQQLVLTFDRRTVRTVCLLDPETRYGVWLRGDWPNNFVGLNGFPAKPYLLQFATSADPPMTSVCEALLADAEGLPPADVERLGGCTARDNETDVVAAQVVRLDAQARAEAQARQERERAAAERLARQSVARQDAADLARAVTLGIAAYGAARDREWAKLEAPADDAHLVGAQGGPQRLSQGSGSFDPRADTANAVLPSAPRGVKRGQATAAMPELVGWRQSVTVNDKLFDCAFQKGAVVCQRHGS